MADVKTASDNQTEGSHTPIDFCPSCLGAAFILALMPFFTRAVNPYLSAFNELGIIHILIVGIFFSMAIMAAVILVLARRGIYPLSRISIDIVGMVLTVLGIVLGAAIELHPVFSALGATVLSGFLIGVGLALLLGIWGHAYGMLRPSSILFHTVLSFFLMSLLWMFATNISDPLVLTVVLCLFAVAGGCLYPVFVRWSTHSSHTPLSFDDKTVSAGAPHTEKAALLFLWTSFFGCMYSFFTSGMTIIPARAGLDSNQQLYSRPVSYAIVAVVVILILLRRRKTSSSDVKLFYTTVLPIAAGVLMVFPFINLNMGQFVNNAIGTAGFMGFSLFYTLSWAAAAMAFSVCNYSVDKAFCALLFLNAVSLLLGGWLITIVGTDGQTLSLGILVVYLVVMTISVIRGAGHPVYVIERTTEFSSAELAELRAAEGQMAVMTAEELMTAKCDEIATKYGLSAREREIITYLAQGRGATRIAEELFISPETVRTHIKRIYEKTGVHKREELIDLISGQDE